MSKQIETHARIYTLASALAVRCFKSVTKADYYYPANKPKEMAIYYGKNCFLTDCELVTTTT